MSSIFTLSERTEKKYTIQDAMDAARALLKDKYRCHSLCINSISHRDLQEKITMLTVNELVVRLVDDTLFYRY